MRTLLALLLLLIAACSPSKPSSESGNRKIHVVTTVGMLADAVQNLGADHVEVTGLMGPGVDPHLYRASEGDMRRLAGADLIVYGGLHLEAKLAEVLHELGSRKPTLGVGETLNPTRLISAQAGQGGSHDPHIWFDVALWAEAVSSITDRLIALAPQHRTDFETRRTTYLQSLHELDTEVRNQLARIPAERRVLVTAHDAFRYFGRAYSVEVRGLQGISTVSEAGTRDVQELSHFIVERRIPAIFVESSVPPKAIEALQEAVRAQGYEVTIGDALFSDAMGNPGTAEGTYIGMVRHNVRALSRALLAQP